MFRTEADGGRPSRSRRSRRPSTPGRPARSCTLPRRRRRRPPWRQRPPGRLQRRKAFTDAGSGRGTGGWRPSWPRPRSRQGRWPVTCVKNVLAPRVTRGYAPDKVVQTFYTSMNTLDHSTMQACVVGGAGGGEINGQWHAVRHLPRHDGLRGPLQHRVRRGLGQGRAEAPGSAWCAVRRHRPFPHAGAGTAGARVS